MAQERTIETTDLDGSPVTLRVGDTFYRVSQHVASDAYRSVDSWAVVTPFTILAISPSGRPAYSKFSTGYSYELPPHRVCITLAQAKRVLLQGAREAAILAAETANRAKALLAAIESAPDTIEGLTIKVPHDRFDPDATEAEA